MNITEFEAAAFYAADNGARSQMLILDMDSCSFALFQCGEDGMASLTIADPAPEQADLREVYASTLLQLLKEKDYTESEVLEAEIRDSLPAADKALRLYLESGRTYNPVFFRHGKVSVSCQELEGALKPACDCIHAMLDRLQPEALETCSIVLTGRAAELWLFEYQARERLSAFPFLPDPRFPVFSDPPERIVELGLQLRKARMAHTYELLLTDRSGAPCRIELARKGQPKEKFLSPQLYTVYKAPGNTVTLQTDDEPVAVPFSPDPDDEAHVLYEIGLMMDSGSPVLCIRDCASADGPIHAVPLPG